MLSPEELGQDASAKDPTRGDDVPGCAHQKIREVRPPRQAAYHAVGKRGPPDAHPDESLEQPFSEEFATARVAVGRERYSWKRPTIVVHPGLAPGVRASTDPAGKRGDQALGRELGAP